MLMPTTKSQPKSFIADRNIISPILGNYFLCFDFTLREFLDKLFSEPFAPQTRINVLLLTLVGRKLRGPKFDLGFHTTRNLMVFAFADLTFLTLRPARNFATKLFLLVVKQKIGNHAAEIINPIAAPN